MLHLDGSSFSGSGTIVRFGVLLAALTGQALHLTNVRARRAPPGLRPQHLKAVEAVTQLCQGTLEGERSALRRSSSVPASSPRGQLPVEHRYCGVYHYARAGAAAGSSLCPGAPDLTPHRWPSTFSMHSCPWCDGWGCRRICASTALAMCPRAVVASK